MRKVMLAVPAVLGAGVAQAATDTNVTTMIADLTSTKSDTTVLGVAILGLLLGFWVFKKVLYRIS